MSKHEQTRSAICKAKNLFFLKLQNENLKFKESMFFFIITNILANIIICDVTSMKNCEVLFPVN